MSWKSVQEAVSPPLGQVPALLANALILSIVGVILALREISSDLYYRSVQEDELLEWASFWAFLVAAVVFVVAAVHQRRATGKLPWFLAGVALFCFVVAMEEISWAQRVFGYRPPAYFLEHNFQQELNVHNVMGTDLRKLALKAVILGYGVALPVLALIPAAAQTLFRLAVVASPWVLTPSFFAAFLIYENYPWSFSGEWVELMVGLGFLFAAIAAAGQLGSMTSPPARWPRPSAAIAAATLLVLVLGAANAAISRRQLGADPEILAAAKTELEALRRDFRSDKVRLKCDNHKRIYAYKEKYDQDYLLEGEFAALTHQGLPEERAEFFLDPWNYPYWYRDRCRDGKSKRISFVYSFGPNRKRESSRWEILGDDVGAVILRKGLDED